MNEIKTKKPIQRINETKNCFFEKISKTDKSLAKLTKRRKERPKLIKLEMKGGIITINTNEIQKIIREYFKNIF
jgi:fatty acid-binding protein DegV